jgi:type II secretory ATPase GspE/PulE/Tfp pilus assembly ATPase PilB-like protein
MLFSTLHTNDAPSAATRLIDMGVPPYMVMTTLQGVLAQRLLRRLCTQCKVPLQPSAGRRVPKKKVERNLALSARALADLDEWMHQFTNSPTHQFTNSPIA